MLKKMFLALIIGILISGSVVGQDEIKISEMTPETIPQDSMIFVVTYDSSGTLVSRRYYWEDLVGALDDNVTLEINTGVDPPVIRVKDGGISANKLATSSVETAKICNLAVTADKIATDAIETNKIKDFNVTSTKLGALSVTAAKIASNAVTAGKIADGGVDETAVLADQIVSLEKLTTDAYNFLSQEQGLDVFSDFYLRDDRFPIRMGLIRNEEKNNLLSVADGTPITLKHINTTTNICTLSYMPYITTIWDPNTNKEWALMNLENTTGAADPAKDGNYTEIFRIDSADYANKVIYYNNTTMKGSESNWDVNDTLAYYNPYEMNWGWPDENPIISNSGAGWRATYVTAGGHFYHSDGSLVLLVNGHSGGNYSIGAFKSDSTDWLTWTALGDTAIFPASGNSDWYHQAIFSSCVLDLPNEDRFIAYVSGYTGSKWTIGWIKFDEDFSLGSIEYSPSVIVDSSGASNGLIAPTVVYYGNNYRMVYTDRSSNEDPTSADWMVVEASSTTPTATFTIGDTILTGRISNDGSYRSCHSDVQHLFMWKGRLYLFEVGTSWYLKSATRANRAYGLFSWDEKLSTPAWVEDTRSPIFFTFYNDDIWPGIDDWAQDHFGGYVSVAMHPDDGKLYLFFSAEAAGDTYKIGVVTLDVRNLLSKTHR